MIKEIIYEKMFLGLILIAALFLCACSGSHATGVQYKSGVCDDSDMYNWIYTYYKVDEYGYATDIRVFEKQWECACDFEFDVGRVREDGLWGLINSKGEYISDPQWDDLSNFDAESHLAKVTRDGKAGYINTKGELVLPLLWQDDKCEPFSEGLARIRNPNEYGYGYMNAQGQLVIDYHDWYDAQAFHDGLALVRENEYPGGSKVISSLGYIDKSGKTQIPFHEEWKECSEFWHGIAYVRIYDPENVYRDKWGVINSNGEWLIEPYYEDASFRRDDNDNLQTVDLDKDDEHLSFDFDNGLYYDQQFYEVGYCGITEEFKDYYNPNAKHEIKDTSVPLVLSHTRPSKPDAAN